MTDPTWTMKPLVDLCKRSDGIRCGPFGTQLSKDEFRKAGVPLWGIKHVNAKFQFATDEYVEAATAGRLAQYDLTPGDLVMTRKGTIGNCAVYPEAFPLGIMHSDLLRLRLDLGEADPSFFVHQLHHSSDVHRQLASISGGAVMPGINVGRLKNLIVRIPPLAEQKRIAGILDAADALRTKRREALAQLDTLLQATFLDMFGDPVTNPKGWEVTKFEAVGTSRLGKMLDKGKQAGNCLSPYLANFNVQWGRFELSELRQMDFDQADREEFTLRNGDLLICEGGEVGRTAIWREELDGVYFQKALHRVRLAPRQAVPEYIMYYMWFMAQNGGFRDFTNAATIAHLTGIKLKSLPTPRPPFDLQCRFATIVESVERQKASQRAHLAELDTLFASLQSRAFRGDL